MNNLRHIFKSLGSLMMIPVALCGMTSCTHKDIIEDIGQTGLPIVNVEYDWAPTEIFRPDGLANLFYSSHPESQSYWRSDLRPNGGSLRLPSDNYDVVAFNNDTENIIFTDIDNFDTFSFSSPQINTSDIPEDQLPFPPQKLYQQPDRMWAALSKDINITETSSPQTITLSPRRITRDYHNVMTGIENLESAIRYYSVVSDLSHKFSIANHCQTGPACSIGNFMQPVDKSTISTTITNFGVNRDSEQQHLAVYMWLADGSKKAYIYDVTEQIREAPDSMNLVIRVKGPSLPVITPGTGGGGTGGMDVGVDNWDIIDIEI